MIGRFPTQHLAAKVHRIVVPKPPIGAKCEVLGEKGLYVLEEGPGNFLHAVCTHAGSGHVEIFDGRVEGTTVVGRKLFRASPMAMGVWHLNAGFQHGLVVDAGGGHESLGAQFSAVWYAKTDLAERSLIFPRKCSYDLDLLKGQRVLTTCDAVLYSVVIGVQGAGRFRLSNGQGKLLYQMQSSFTGSFLLEHVYAAGGLILDVDYSAAPAITFNWLERSPDELEPASPLQENPNGRRTSSDAGSGASSPGTNTSSVSNAVTSYLHANASRLSASPSPSADAGSGAPAPEPTAGPIVAERSEASSDAGGDSGPGPDRPSTPSRRGRKR